MRVPATWGSKPGVFHARLSRRAVFIPLFRELDERLYQWSNRSSLMIDASATATVWQRRRSVNSSVSGCLTAVERPARSRPIAFP